jgi:hypothetical protein
VCAVCQSPVGLLAFAMNINSVKRRIMYICFFRRLGRQRQHLVLITIRPTKTRPGERLVSTVAFSRASSNRAADGQTDGHSFVPMDSRTDIVRPWPFRRPAATGEKEARTWHVVAGLRASNELNRHR